MRPTGLVCHGVSGFNGLAVLVAGLNHSTSGAGAYDVLVGCSRDAVDREQRKSTTSEA
jgi:hypothetical protein